MTLLKALVPTGLVIMSGVLLRSVTRMAWRGYAGILWTLGAFLCVAFLALALYCIKKFFGEKDEDEERPDR